MACAGLAVGWLGFRLSMGLSMKPSHLTPDLTAETGEMSGVSPADNAAYGGPRTCKAVLGRRVRI
jgi:hypothetical protein